MKRSTAPYGEARRLRYFVLICRELLKSPSVDIDFFIDKLLVSANKINPQLAEYVRTTGVMRTPAVTRNYLRFAGWLTILRLENRLVVPNSYTVFFANLGEREDFFLTTREKVGFFLNLIKLPKVFDLLASLKIRNAVKHFTRRGLSEHFVETFFEWFVDLDVVRPTSPSFGMFTLSNLGYYVSESCKRELESLEISGTFISHLLDVDIKYGFDIPDDTIWSSLEKSLQKLARYTRSEVDFNLYSALPLILDLQVRLVFDFNRLVSISQLIQKLKDISPHYNTIFSWNALAKAGYIKKER